MGSSPRCWSMPPPRRTPRWLLPRCGSRNQPAASGRGVGLTVLREAWQIGLVPVVLLVGGDPERGDLVLPLGQAAWRFGLGRGHVDTPASRSQAAISSGGCSPYSARAAALGADYVLFTSASSVRSFVAAAGAPASGQRIVSIGPVTSDALREHDLEPHVEAPEHTPDGLVAALLGAVGTPL